MRMFISIKTQTLELRDDALALLRRYAVSTAKNGAGEQSGSYCTPRGRHVIRAKIGAGAQENTVFVRRRPTGEVWSPQLAAAHPGRDWILTRILWLSGCEPGFNRGGSVDTMRRYIYLHGSPDTVAMGAPGSIGCVRMKNRDIMELFDLVPAYTPVEIAEFGVLAGTWDTLSAAARPVREAVFIREQKVPRAMEWDADDASSHHVVALSPADQPIGTARLTSHAHIGRVAVLPAWRGKGVGAALMKALLDVARQQNRATVALHAQTSAAGFYQNLGFQSEGETFMEAGMAHVLMTRSIPRNTP